MKNILLATFVLGLIGCTSQKKLETSNIPFEINQSSVQEWSGGRAESGSGTELKIVISEIEDMNFEKVYFRARALDCDLKTENDEHTITASFKRDNKTDMIDEDGKKMQMAFELSPNQAVLAYRKIDGKLKYVKVNSIKEKKPILYKGRPKN